METLDEQLDAATARVEELEAQLANANESAATLIRDKEILETVNAELKDNLAATKDKLAQLEVKHGEALTAIDRLKAEAKTAEERAAEIYGARASEPVAVTAKGDPVRPVIERFRAITDPGAQTQFIRNLTEEERTELFTNL